MLRKPTTCLFDRVSVEYVGLMQLWSIMQGSPESPQIQTLTGVWTA